MFKNFASQVEQGNKIDGFNFMFVAVHRDSHITGGTEAGCNFLRTSGSYVPYSFWDTFLCCNTLLVENDLYIDFFHYLCLLDLDVPIIPSKPPKKLTHKQILQ